MTPTFRPFFIIRLYLIVAACFIIPSYCGAEQPQASQSNASSTASSGELNDLKKQMLALRELVEPMRQELDDLRQERSELLQLLQDVRQRLSEAYQSGSEPRSGASGDVKPPCNAGRTNDPCSQSDEASTNLAKQLEALREDHQLLTSKVETQYINKVESGSNHRVRFSGMVLMNLFSDRGTVDDIAQPAVAEERGALDSKGSFGATLRQSLLGVEVFGPSIAGAKTRGDIRFDFGGGFPKTENGSVFGLMRLRTATANFEWANTAVVAGQDTPFISPLSPASLASLALPAMSYSGNGWTWTPQVRIERRMLQSENSYLLLQGGILAPISGAEPSNPIYQTAAAGESSRQPAYASRIAWTHHSAQELPLTIGAGAYLSRQYWGSERHINAWTATADWNLPLGNRWSVSGEFYRGQALGALGAGNAASVLILSPNTTDVRPLRSAGGWSQLRFTATSRLEINGAFGEDYALNRDVLSDAKGASENSELHKRNETFLWNAIFHARSNVLFSLEYRRLWTTNIFGERHTADHINLATGISF